MEEEINSKEIINAKEIINGKRSSTGQDLTCLGTPFVRSRRSTR